MCITDASVQTVRSETFFSAAHRREYPKIPAALGEHGRRLRPPAAKKE